MLDDATISTIGLMRYMGSPVVVPDTGAVPDDEPDDRVFDAELTDEVDVVEVEPVEDPIVEAGRVWLAHPIVDAVIEPEVDEPRLDEPRLDEPRVDEPRADEPRADEPGVDEPPAADPLAALAAEVLAPPVAPVVPEPTRTRPARTAPTRKPPARKPPARKAPTRKAPTRKAPTQKPPARKTPRVEPRVEPRPARKPSRRLTALLATPVALEHPRRELLTASRVGIAIALAAWIVSIPSLKSAAPSNYGLLFTASKLFTLSTLIAVLAFCSAVRRGRFGDAVAALLAFVVIVRATVSIITPLPIYTWTYKHIGVADYISQHGHVASGADIYMAWPGAFAAISWFSSVTGVSMMALAQWFALGVHLLIALGIYAFARAAHLSPMAAISAAFLAEIVNWVGQDYLSPQAIAFVMALFVLTMLLRSRESKLAGWLSVPGFAAIVVTHQLTPYWLALIAVVLGLGRAVRPRWIGFVYAGIALAYLAIHFRIAAEYGLISGFDPLANAESNVSTTGSAGHDFTGLMVKIPALLLWGTALVVAFRQWRAARRLKKSGATAPAGPGLPWWVPPVLAFASFTLLAGQSYGGEAIFRVFLYSLPGCVLVVAPLFVRALLSTPSRTGRARRAAVRWGAIGATLLAAGTSLQGYYGGWFTNVVRQDSLDEITLLLRTLPADSLILTMTSGLPERPIGRYVAFEQQNKFFDGAVQLFPDIHPKTDSATQIARTLERLQGRTSGPVYLIITEQMRQYSSYYGVFKPGMLYALPKVLRTDGHWWTISDTSTLQVFRLVGNGG